MFKISVTFMHLSFLEKEKAGEEKRKRENNRDYIKARGE